MKYLHVAIIEDYEECLVSESEEGLRNQVDGFLNKKNLTPPTDEEWRVCIMGASDADIEIDNPANPALGLISYYKTVSLLA